MNAEELIRMHLGNLMVQVAVLQVENAELKAELEKYRPAPKENVKELPVKKG